MLHLDFGDNRVRYDSGIGIRQSVTRYAGEYWDRTASDLLCGVADAFQDVGIILTAEGNDADANRVKNADPKRWTAAFSGESQAKSIWHRSENRGWLFVPWSREAVEDVTAWTMPYLRGETITKGSRATAFSGHADFRCQLSEVACGHRDDELWNLIERYCEARQLFSMTWGWTFWELHAGTICADQLLKLADPVVARINAVNTD